MFSLLNRIAWIVSLLLGMVFCSVIIGIFESYSTMADAFFGGIICGFFFKGILLSSSRIERAVMNITPSLGISKQVNIVDNSALQATSVIVPEPVQMQNTLQELVISKQSQDDVEGVESQELLQQEYSEPPTIQIVPEEPSKFILWIKEFFSDRPLAKIGGILLFLGALFFLYLIFDLVPPFGKVIIGLLFGFTLIGVGIYLDKRNITTESRVLFGVGLAVNYLTILAARYILGMGALSDASPIFSDVATTIFLLLNTSLAVIMALMYRSRILLGFAFIFAYLTPFLVGSHSETTYLLSVYTTLLTVAIGVINFFYSKMNQNENINYLQMIGVIGMIALFSLSGIASHMLSEVLVISAGLSISVTSLALFAWKMKQSPIFLFVATYIVLFVLVGAGGGIGAFALLPFFTIAFLFLIIAFVLLGTLDILVVSGLAVGLFLLAIIGFFVDGVSVGGLSTLLAVNTSIFVLLGIVILRSASLLLGMIAIVGMTISMFVSMSFLDISSVGIGLLIAFKSLSIATLIGSSIFSLRTRESTLFFLSVILSGILLLYPNMTSHPGIFAIFTGVFTIVSLFVPALLLRGELASVSKAFLIGSLPVGALILVMSIYQLSSSYDVGSLAKGFIYLLEAGVYLVYAMILSRRFLGTYEQQALSGESKTTLLVLFALPLSLATFALAFIFQDNTSVMSLAWMIESSILYMVYTRMHDMRIFLFASAVFAIGIFKYLLLIGGLNVKDYFAFGISLLALVSVFSSLVLLRREDCSERTVHDILHLIAILVIGGGIDQIIPSTGTGWSLFGMAGFLMIIAPIYALYGRALHKIFLSAAMFVFIVVFLGKFDNLRDTIPALGVQWSAIILFVGVGYIGMRSKALHGYIQLIISILGFLILSSLYVDRFFTTFAVSIYLAAIATFLIIRGITQDNPRLRTIGLYVGAFALIKIFFFDIWTQIDGSILKVVALMLSGGLMIYLSQLYGNYVHRSWREEFAWSEIFGFLSRLDSQGAIQNHEETRSGDSENNDDEAIDILPFHEDLAKELENIDISDISAVRFVTLSEKSFTTKRLSVLRLVRYITLLMKKDTFAPGELGMIYQRVIEHLQSNMKKDDLDKLLAQISGWIVEGGKIEFIQK